MTAKPSVGVPTALRVALSRKELHVAAGEVGAVGGFVAPADRPLAVNVAASANARVGLAPDQLGEFATDSFQLPQEVAPPSWSSSSKPKRLARSP